MRIDGFIATERNSPVHSDSNSPHLRLTFHHGNTRSCFASNFIAKSSQPIAITIRFGSLVLSDEEYNQRKFAQLACRTGNRARRSAAVVRSSHLR